jgi:hypothetical protein
MQAGMSECAEPMEYQWIPFKSKASGCMTPNGYAYPGRMVVKSFIPFPVENHH